MKRGGRKMRNLLYKEFHLAIHPLFFLVLVFGALLLIPEWIYFLAVMYFFFITFPNIFAMGKAQNDIGFSAMLPVKRSDIVKARILSIVILEVLQIFVTAMFAVINLLIYPRGNSLLDANATYIGCVFIIYAIFNVIFFPMFYKTAYKIGFPVIIANIAAVAFATGVELLNVFVPWFKVFDGREHLEAQLFVLAGGIIIFTLLNIAAFRMSAKRFDSVNI
jgi:ABC-2 type transport system permease protein